MSANERPEVTKRMWFTTVAVDAQMSQTIFSANMLRTIPSTPPSGSASRPSSSMSQTTDSARKRRRIETPVHNSNRWV